MNRLWLLKSRILGEFGVPRVRGIAKSDEFIQELDALFNQDAVFENVIDCRLREVKYDKEVLEKEWLDLTPFLRDRLRSRNSWFLFTNVCAKVSKSDTDKIESFLLR